LEVPGELWRSAHRDEQDWIDSGVFAVELLGRVLGRADLAGVDVLDVGCGTKIVKTLLDGSLPIGRYVGVDVSPDVIAWLRANVADPRFEFHHLDARNDLYHPTGPALSELGELPVDGARFDLECLFSVFTHLGPEDFVAMLHLLRRHVKPDGRLVFSLFLDDPDHPSWLAQRLQEAMDGDDPELAARARAAVAEAAGQDRRFVDEDPDQPLLRARYQPDYARELVDGTGWEILSVNPPEEFIQHFMICRPA
jgi:SAM-dependent methyltransferase